MSGNPNLMIATWGGTETLQRILLSDKLHMTTVSIAELFSSPVPEVYGIINHVESFDISDYRLTVFRLMHFKICTFLHFEVAPATYPLS